MADLSLDKCPCPSKDSVEQISLSPPGGEAENELNEINLPGSDSSDSETSDETVIARENNLESKIFRLPDVRDIAEVMRCSNCDHIVVLSSTMLNCCEMGHYICDSCKGEEVEGDCPVRGDGAGGTCVIIDEDEEENGRRSSVLVAGFPLYQAVFNAADFKCKYTVLGCKKMVTSLTMEGHHRDCPFRPTERCIFSDCGNYLASQFEDHYDNHRLKFLSESSKVVAVLYDRPEEGPLDLDSSLEYKLRWVSCIFHYYENYFLLCVEKYRGDWIIWFYILDDQPNRDKFKVRMELHNKNNGESRIGPKMLDVLPRSLTSDEIRESSKCIKLTAEEILANLYQFGRGLSDDPRYLIYSITILDNPGVAGAEAALTELPVENPEWSENMSQLSAIQTENPDSNGAGGESRQEQIESADQSGTVSDTADYVAVEVEVEVEVEVGPTLKQDKGSSDEEFFDASDDESEIDVTSNEIQPPTRASKTVRRNLTAEPNGREGCNVT